MNLIIRHRPGKNADALSRNPAVLVGVVEADGTGVSSEVVRTGEAARSVVGASDKIMSGSGLVEESEESDEAEGSGECGDEVVTEPTLEKLLEIRDLQQLVVRCRYLEHGQLPDGEQESWKLVLESRTYEVMQGVLYYEPPTVPGRLCVVVPEALRAPLLQEAHATILAGHFAFRRVYDKIRRQYWWNGLQSDVHKFCRSCLVCTSRRGPGRPLHPPLAPIPVGGPFHRVGVDVLQLPLTRNGNQYVVCFVDYLTKWVEAFAMPDQQAETIAWLFVDNVVCRHGVLEELLSDRGLNFLSNLVQGVCEVLGVKRSIHQGTTPRPTASWRDSTLPLIAMISKCCETAEHDWDEHLQMLMFAYRSSVHGSTKESPFFLLYGRDPRLPTETALSETVTPYLVDLEDYRTELVRCRIHGPLLGRR